MCHLAFLAPLVFLCRTFTFAQIIYLYSSRRDRRGRDPRLYNFLNVVQGLKMCFAIEVFHIEYFQYLCNVKLIIYSFSLYTLAFKWSYFKIKYLVYSFSIVKNICLLSLVFREPQQKVFSCINCGHT